MKAFASYAHANQNAVEPLLTRIKQTQAQDGVTIWSDHNLVPGDKFDPVIRDAIDQADIVLLMLSVAFFHSGYIVNDELPAIRDRAARPGGRPLRIVPILLEPMYWESLLNPFGSVFAGLNAVPLNTKRQLTPLSRWRPRNEGHHETHAAVRLAMKTHRTNAPIPTGATP